MKYFKTWLIKKYLKVENPFGDLARDIKGDRDFPRTNKQEKIYDYLWTCNACSECLKTFNLAYEEYKREIK